MAIDYIRPSADKAVAWTPSTPGTHWNLVDDAATQPEAPDTADYVNNGGDNSVNDDFTMQNLAVAAATRIDVYVYAKKDSADPAPFSVNISLNNGTSWETLQIITLTTSWGWYVKTWTGAYTQAQINALLARIRYGMPVGEAALAYVAAVQLKITYTPVAAAGKSRGHIF